MDTAIVVGAGPAGLAAAARCTGADTTGGPRAAGRDRPPGAPLRPAAAELGALVLDAPRRPAYPPARGLPVTRRRRRLPRAVRRGPWLDVRLGIGVDSIDRDGDAWRSRPPPATLHATDVVFARRLRHRPFVPAWAGRATASAAALLHAADYRDARRRTRAGRARRRAGLQRRRDRLRPRRGRRGAGPARGPHAAEHHRPRADRRAARRGVHETAAARSATPSCGFVRRRTVGDLSAFGLPVPDEGVFSRLRRLHVAPMIVDAEVIDAIRDAPDRDRRARSRASTTPACCSPAASASSPTR